MAEFGTVNLDELAVEDQRLNAEQSDNKRDIYITIPRPAKKGAASSHPVRILPPLVGEKLFQANRLHMVKGTNGQTHTLHCPRELVPGKNGNLVWDYNTPCPICDYVNDLFRKAEKLEKMGKKVEADKLRDEARQIKAVERYYYNAIERSFKDAEGNVVTNAGPKVLSIGKSLHKIVFRGLRGEPENKIKPVGGTEGKAVNIKDGHDLIIMMELRGEQNFPNYDRSHFDNDPSPAGSVDEIKKWVENMHDLKSLRRPATVEQLEHELARHLGYVEDEDNEYDLDALAAKHGKTRNSGAAKATSPAGTVATETLTAPEPDAEDTVPPPPAEDTSIDDEAFVAELQGLMESE